MSVVPPSAERVRAASSKRVNLRIRAATASRLRGVARDTEAIDRRLAALDREWDIERALEATAATFTVVGSALAVGRDRRWGILPLVVGSFLVQHAVQGWCPPLVVFRALRFRSPREIEDERQALKAMRGDYGLVRRPDGALAAAERK